MFDVVLKGVQRRRGCVVNFFIFLKFDFFPFLARLHEVQKSYCSHPPSYAFPFPFALPLPFPSHFVKVF